jgi:vitamin B12 transporter
MHRKLTKTRLIFFIWLVIASSTMLADDEKTETSETILPEVKLLPYAAVSTRTPLPLDKLSPSVIYISEAEMLQNQDRSLVDALKRQSGIILNTTGTKGAQTSLFIRGTNSDHTGFFLDGRRLNPGFSNQFGLEFLSIDNLSSVEVQKGPSTVNFGSSGIGGVVSLQTNSNLGEKTESVRVEAELGSYDSYRGALSASLADEDWALSLGTSALTTENKRDNDEFEMLNWNSRAEYKLTEHLIVELIGLVTQSNRGFPGSVTFRNDTAEGETHSWLVSPGLRYEIEDWSGQLFYSGNKQVLQDEFDANNIIRSDEVYSQVDYTGIEDLLFSFGMLYRNDEAEKDSLLFLNRFEQIGFWSQVQLQLTDAFEVRLGGRFDEYTDFKSSANGSVEALYTFFDFGTTVFAKLANSYAPPSATDIVFDGNLQDSVQVNTFLNPEESESYEIGFRYTGLKDTLECSAVLFRNEIENLIDFLYEQRDFNDPSTIITNDSFNIDRATTEGIEFTINYGPIEQLNLSCAYTYLDAVSDDTDDRLLRRPRHLLHLAANYQITNDLFGGIQGTGYFDRKDIDAGFNTVDHEDYFVVNILTDYDLSEKFTLFARIENLLDERYESVLGYPALGRTAFIGGRLTF